MSDKPQSFCPECDLSREGLDRREFMLTGTTGLLAVGGLASSGSHLWADQPPLAPNNHVARPAESLIQELFGTLSDEQKRRVVYPWNHGAAANRLPTRQGMYNAAIFRDHKVGDVYTPAQQELVQRILRAISSGDDGFQKITRNGTFDGSQNLRNCGAFIFGDPTNQRQFAWVFSGHHLTVRCDGNSEANAAFGGPIYYGHSPDGYSQRNIFFYQTRSVLSVFDALNENQRRQAIVVGSPGELEPSIRFRPAGQPHPGIPAGELTADQRRLVETVMRDILAPFRQEDTDEVMEIVRRNGGIQRIHLAFYRDQEATDNSRWHFWRLEGPGFVWNYRVLPHVHTYVNIAAV